MKIRNLALDGIRGYGVLLVFMVHFWGAYSSMPGHSVAEHFDFSFSQPWQNNLLFYGQHSHYGVDLFFVLSGFLIASILQSPSMTIGRFVFNRVLRIYPAFLLSFVLALFLWKWSFGQAVELSVALKNIFFLNGILFLKIPAVNGVTWSLFYETSFYLAMALLVFVFGRIILNRARIILLLGVLIVVILILLFGHYRGGMSLGMFLHLFLGAALAGEVRGGKRLGELLGKISTSIVLFAWFSFTTLFSLGLINYPDWYYYPISGIATMLIISKVGFAPGVMKDFFSWRPLVLLGQVSYSFYLLHALIILWIFRSTLQPSNIVILFCLSFSACLAAAIGSYMLAERPYFKRSNMHTQKSRRENSRYLTK